MLIENDKITYKEILISAKTYIKLSLLSAGWSPGARLFVRSPTFPTSSGFIGWSSFGVFGANVCSFFSSLLRQRRFQGQGNNQFLSASLCRLFFQLLGTRSCARREGRVQKKEGGQKAELNESWTG